MLSGDLTGIFISNPGRERLVSLRFASKCNWSYPRTFLSPSILPIKPEADDYERRTNSEQNHADRFFLESEQPRECQYQSAQTAHNVRRDIHSAINLRIDITLVLS